MRSGTDFTWVRGEQREYWGRDEFRHKENSKTTVVSWSQLKSVEVTWSDSLTLFFNLCKICLAFVWKIWPPSNGLISLILFWKIMALRCFKCLWIQSFNVSSSMGILTISASVLGARVVFILFFPSYPCHASIQLGSLRALIFTAEPSHPSIQFDTVSCTYFSTWPSYHSFKPALLISSDTYSIISHSFPTSLTQPLTLSLSLSQPTFSLKSTSF